MKKILLWVAGIALAMAVVGSFLPNDEEPAAKAATEPATEPQKVRCADAGPPDETAGELVERCKPTSNPLPPEPTAGQAEDLVASLAAIEPSLADEFDGTVDNARSTCNSILGGSETLIDSTIDRFAYDAGYDYSGRNQMPESVAMEILAVIEAEPWCKNRTSKG